MREYNPAIQFFDAITRGFGQIMLQNNRVTGLLFIAGIAFHSPIMAVMGLIGAFASTTFAGFVGYSDDDIDNGLYGFNGALVGVASGYFYAISVPSIALTMLCAALSSMIMNIMMRRMTLPPYTMPFILATWVMMALANNFAIPSANHETLHRALIGPLFNSFGQIIFQENYITGIMFAIGVFVSSIWAGIMGVVGGLIAVISAMCPDANLQSMAQSGLIGYNAVLCGIAMGVKPWKLNAAALMAILLSVVVLYGFMFAGIPALTAPFVLACWTVRLISQHGTKMNTA